MKVNTYIHDKLGSSRALFFILIDPDKISGKELHDFAKEAELAGVDAFLAGGSLMMHGDLETAIADLKAASQLPVIIFPGNINQVSKQADAILFISLISGRNPEHLIGKQVMAAPLIKRYGLEPLPTGYMLIESGVKTTAEYISGSSPIPRNKPEIAAATALAAEMLGMKYIYLEAGSGAQNHVPEEMVTLVSRSVSIPVIAGGGIKSPETADALVRAGAKIIVTGNHFETKENRKLLGDFVKAVKG